MASELAPSSVTADVFGVVAPTKDETFPLARIEDDLRIAEGLLKAALSPGTRRTYAHVWRDFETYCLLRNVASLPAEPTTVTAFLAWLASSAVNRKGGTGQKYATVSKALAAVTTVHRLKGFPGPGKHELVKRELEGIARAFGKRQDPVDALTADECRQMLASCTDSIEGDRNRVILLMGFCGAFRRSELVGLDVGDLDFRPEGLVVHLRKSKTDQQGAGVDVAVRSHPDKDLCVVVALRRYLDNASVQTGPVFLSVTRKGKLTTKRMCGQAVWRVVHDTAQACGLSGRLGAHSMRAGFVTEAAKARKPLHAIMKKTRHKRVDTVMRYVRTVEAFDDDAAEGLL